LIVLGAGLAGAAMAWQAHWRGWSVAIIDRQDAQSSSRVAAGLVTPITGSRAAASWRWNEFYPEANLFYRRVEHVSGSSFWNVEPALRSFRSQSEKDLYQGKWLSREFATDQDAIRVSMCEGSTPRGLKAPFGICRFEPSARLDTCEYLDATRRFFESLDAFHLYDLNCDTDIVFESMRTFDSVVIPALQLSAKYMVFCQGIAARENRFFADLPLHPARGDILEVQSQSVDFDQVLHHDAWLVPIGQHRYLLGATYDRLESDTLTTPESKAERFRSELIHRWESMISGTFQDGQHTVLGQRWAIRPASYDRHPLLGAHDLFASAFCLNGLGSKGTLMAPLLANKIIGSMEGTPIEPSLLLSRKK
jgi:glycine/D-amino acid oxidase-like deaminating enzyme